jgi:hypothetical protein
LAEVPKNILVLLIFQSSARNQGKQFAPTAEAAVAAAVAAADAEADAAAPAACKQAHPTRLSQYCRCCSLRCIST